MASSDENQVVGCHTVEQWNAQLKLGESKKLVVVDFTATWCGPCRLIAPIFDEIAKKTPEVLFLKVDVDELKSVAEEWDVQAMPTFIFLKEGKKVDTFVGVHKEGLLKKIAEHSGVTATATATASA